MFSTKLNISNIKISAKISAYESDIRDWFLNNRHIVKESGSFFVYRLNKFVYCIYFKGHVNITGLKNRGDVESSVKLLTLLPFVKSAFLKSIDNITCSGKLSEENYSWNISFAKYLKKLSETDINIKFHPQVFPGAFLKFETQEGTIVFFATGKFNIVGCKSFSSILKLLTRFGKSVQHVRMD